LDVIPEDFFSVENAPGGFFPGTHQGQGHDAGTGRSEFDRERSPADMANRQADGISPRLIRLWNPIHSRDRAGAGAHATILERTYVSIAGQIESRGGGDSCGLAVRARGDRYDRTGEHQRDSGVQNSESHRLVSSSQGECDDADTSDLSFTARLPGRKSREP